VFGLFGLSVAEVIALALVVVFVVWPLVQRVRKSRHRSR
jgi:predicted PurR-regulated permease PerM